MTEDERQRAENLHRYGMERTNRELYEDAMETFGGVRPFWRDPDFKPHPDLGGILHERPRG